MSEKAASVERLRAAHEEAAPCVGHLRRVLRPRHLSDNRSVNHWVTASRPSGLLAPSKANPLELSRTRALWLTDPLSLTAGLLSGCSFRRCSGPATGNLIQPV